MYIYYLDEYCRDIYQVKLIKETEKSWTVESRSGRSLLRPGSYVPWIPSRMSKRQHTRNVFRTIDEAWEEVLHQVDRDVESARKRLCEAEEGREETYQDKVAWDALEENRKVSP